MSLSGVVAGIAILVLCLVWLLLLFLRASAMKSAVEREQQRDRLSMAAAYERTLMTVRDLDEDYQVGKLPQDVYEAERARWAEHGAKLLQMIEAATKPAESPKKSRQEKKRRTAETAEPVTTTPVPEDDPVEAAIAAYEKARERARDS